MRLGRNPVKERLKAPVPEKVTVALLTHVPFQAGYHSAALDVLSLSLASIYRNTSVPHDVLVFDNGSDDQVKGFLKGELDAGRIQYLILSQNVGKARAWNSMLAAAPGEFVAYADGDVFFHPGWLDRHLEIFEAFPEAGMVTGLPMRHLAGSFTESTIKTLENDPETVLERGKLLPKEAVSAFCEGVGTDLDVYLDQFSGVEDIRVTRCDVAAFVGASHFQFVVRKTALAEVLPLEAGEDAMLLGKRELALDAGVDAAGYLRLSTVSPVCVHLGNSLTPNWIEVANTFGQHPPPSGMDVEGHLRRLVSRFSQWPFVKRWLLWLYSEIFWLYYVNPKQRKQRKHRRRQLEK